MTQPSGSIGDVAASLEVDIEDGRLTASSINVIFEAVEGTEVRSEDPLELLVTVELDGDRLEVTLDETATVIDVTEDPE